MFITILAEPVVRVYGNPGFYDLYTVVIDRQDGIVEFYSMSDHPLHPQGVNMFDGTNAEGFREGSHLGKRLKNIPSSIMEAVEKRIRQ